MESITVKTMSGKDYLTLKEDSIVVFWLKKERVVPISQIISFEVKDPKGKWRPGMIRIQLGGAPGSYVKLTSFFAFGDSGNIEFPHAYEYLEDAHRIKEYIASYSSKPTMAAAPSAADEIIKYKGLLDCRAITEEEFNEKKKQLLEM